MITIRSATEDDMNAMQQIYAHHVLHGSASFEITPPDIAELTARFTANTSLGLPWVLAEEDGVTLGYAYAGLYRARPAYRSTVENSVYLDPAAQKKGIGVMLLERVIEDATRMGKRQMIAVIGDSNNTGSIRLHEKLGFQHAGVLKNVGYKHGRWLDSVFMQLELGDGDRTPPANQSIS